MGKKLDTLLPVKVAGIQFRNPFIVGSGPTAKWTEQLVEAEETGWGGVSIKLTMDPPPYINPQPRYRWYSDEGFHIFTSEERLEFKVGLKLVEEGRKKTKEIPLFANMAYFGDKGLAGWEKMAKKFESAGAHALELNFCCPNMSFSREQAGKAKKSGPRSGASLGSDPEIVGMIVKSVADCVSIPVFAKVTPEGGNIGEVAKAAVSQGASGISSVGNRTGMPPFDIDHPERTTYRLQQGFSVGCMSGPWLKPLALKDVFQIRKAIGPEPPVIGLGGIRNYTESIERTMVGADLIGICTETMLRGFRILPGLVRGTKEYMKRAGCKKFSELRDGMIPSLLTAPQLKSLPGHAEVEAELCTGCGLCVAIGHCQAIELGDKKACVKVELCAGCATCTDICPENAICMIAA